MNIYKERWENLLGECFRIHPGVKFGKGVRIGEGTVIEDGCEIGDNVMIGHNCVLRPNTIVGNDTKISHFHTSEEGVRIGNHCNLGVYSHLTKDVVMEDWVFYATGAMTLNAKHILYGRDGTTILEPPRFCYGARIGAQVVIMPGVKIGREALIGARSLVMKNVPEKECWAGSPAKFIKAVSWKELVKT
ncbi:MAG TPA: DapH/DapD/GlmU-related protein [archaeon]|nr:DapH/DapD/GlmU-related protein [archaeon]